MLHPNWVIVGAVLMLVGSWSYLVDTIKGKVKPNRVSWLLWSIAPLIGSFAQFQQGVGILSLSTFIVGFVPMIIFVATFINKGEDWKISKFDLFCGLLSVVGLVLWIITKVGNVAILFAIFADALAAAPTLIKSYRFPDTENDTLYWFGVLNSVIALMTVATWKFEYWGFPLYLLVVNLMIAAAIRFRFGVRR